MVSPRPDPLSRLLARYGAWVMGHRGLAAVGCALLTLVIVAGAGARVAREGLPVDFTPQALFMDQAPEMLRLLELEQGWGRDDNDLVLVLDGLVDQQGAAEAIRALHGALAAHPDVERVDSVATARVATASLEGLRVDVPLDALPLPQALARVAADPALGGLIVARDGSAVAFRARIARERARVAELRPVLAELRAAAAEVPLPEGTTLHATGVPFVRVDVVDLMLRDQARFLPLVALLFAVTICLLFRRVKLGLAVLFGVLLGAIWATGALVIGGATFNILSMIVPTLVVVIGSSDGIHITARYREELARPGVEPAEAMATSLRWMTTACLLTSATTAAGFGSLVVAQTRIVREFGVQCAVAVMATFVALMIALPCLLAFIPPAAVRRSTAHATSRGQRALAGLDRFVQRRASTILVTTLAVTALAGAWGGTVRTELELMEMYPPQAEARRALSLVEDKLGGVVPIFFHVAGTEDALKSPDALRRIDALERLLASREEVLWSTGFAAHVRELHRLLAGEDRLPEDTATIAQELLVAELFERMPFEGLVDDEFASTRVLALVADVGGRASRTMRTELVQGAAAIFEGSDLSVELTGDGIMATVGLDILVEDLVGSLGVVLLVILVALWLLLRDTRLTLIAVLPNLLPLVFTLAAIKAMGGDLRVTNIVTFSVAIGLAVDDTIHFLVRYRQERQAGADIAEAVGRTYAGAGHAIVLTSILLVVGFGVLATSELTSTRDFGVLAAVTMVAALAGDLLLLPALLHLGGRRRWVTTTAEARGAETRPETL